MSEMRDVAGQEQPEAEPRSPTVSFPDHYLIPYIEKCKQSKPITCCWGIIFIVLAIFCFFATNYMINYPVTVSRKIAFVFGGVFCLVAAASCLNLRFRILEECRGGAHDDVQFEIARRGTDFSVSFSGDFTMNETSFCNGTPKEGQSQNETEEDTLSRAHTIDDPCFPCTSTVLHNGHAALPRHSISRGMTPDTPLLPQNEPLELSRTPLTKKRMDSKQIHNSRVASDHSKPNLPNYSTFENGFEASNDEERLLTTESTFQNGCVTPESELAEGNSQNGRDALEIELLLKNIR